MPLYGRYRAAIEHPDNPYMAQIAMTSSFHDPR
jgi:hypothetical protein